MDRCNCKFFIEFVVSIQPLFRWNLPRLEIQKHNQKLCFNTTIVSVECFKNYERKRNKNCFNTTIVSVESFFFLHKFFSKSGFNTTIVSVESLILLIIFSTCSAFQYNHCFGGMVNLRWRKLYIRSFNTTIVSVESIQPF